MSLSSLQRTVEMVWPQKHSSTFQAVALEKLRWFCLWKVAQGRMTVIASEIWTHLVCKRIWLPDQRSSFLEKYTSLLLFSSLILNYSSNTASTYFLSKYVFNLLINNTSLLKMRFPFFFFFLLQGDGYYMAVPAFVGHKKDMGRLKLLLTDLKPKSSYCLIFSYRLAGERVGKLRVFLANKKTAPVWEQNKGKDERWRTGKVEIFQGAETTNSVSITQFISQIP